MKLTKNITIHQYKCDVEHCRCHSIKTGKEWIFFIGYDENRKPRTTDCWNEFWGVANYEDQDFFDKHLGNMKIGNVLNCTFYSVNGPRQVYFKRVK